MSEVSVVLIGCGCPLRSMGWYHAVQILDGRVPHAKLTHVVEPWYMSASAKGTPGYDDFMAWKAKQETLGIKFYEKVTDVPKLEGIFLAIISARTPDNPKLLEGAVDIGCNAIYLEKPGAPTVQELETMKKKAAYSGVKVFMGFNKNVSSYLTKARAFANNSDKKCDVTFLHNNNYADTEEQLSECFERNSEGMLRNMLIHELAIAVSFYGVTVDAIKEVLADKGFSSCKTLKGPSSGKDFTDFDKLKFKIVTKSGGEVNVAADRCAGDNSDAIVTDASSGAELARFSMPDEETIANAPKLKEKYGDAMPYFFAQDPDYLKLKNLVVKNCLDGTPADGVATIDDAIETLKVAEFLTPLLLDQLK
jgi:predicted dehydrogenase